MARVVLLDLGHSAVVALAWGALHQLHRPREVVTS
jgi:hypothetical protein